MKIRKLLYLLALVLVFVMPYAKLSADDGAQAAGVGPGISGGADMSWYSLSKGESNNCTFSCNVWCGDITNAYVQAGTIITLKDIAAEDSFCGEFSYTINGGDPIAITAINDIYYFVMPEGDVVISAHFWIKNSPAFSIQLKT